jgi:hypothetical protein
MNPAFRGAGMDKLDTSPSIKSLSRFYVNYLFGTEKPVGLVLNFGERKVEIKRKVKACPGAT